MTLFSALSINPQEASRVAKTLEIPVDRLRYYENSRVFPSGHDLKKLCEHFNVSEKLLRLKMGVFDHALMEELSQNADKILGFLPQEEQGQESGNSLTPEFTTELGKLYQSDCIRLMNTMADDSVDLIFADPPFNLKKLYPSQIDDNLREEKYIVWYESWLNECIRILKPGGSLFVWNLPRWNSYVTKFLNDRLTFKHWIAVDIKYSLPIAGRLYPSHYSLLYYVKGEKANTFKPDRLPMEVCTKCYGDLRDYGGYKDKMNPLGVNMADVWYDIPPVRHAKYKRRVSANELSIKLLDRIIEMASEEGDVVFDPFGGSGTTYIVAEIKNRRWIGVEIGPLEDIVNRFAMIDEERLFIQNIRENLNHLFVPEVLKKRQKLGLWTPESVRKKNGEKSDQLELLKSESFTDSIKG